MDSLISRIPELQKTICDEIEGFSVVGYQAFESQPRTVLNLERRFRTVLWLLIYI